MHQYGNEQVKEKLRINNLKDGNRPKPSKIEILNDIILVTANNTKNKFIFDFDEEIFSLLNGKGWNEDSKGYLLATINKKRVKAHILVYELKNNYKHTKGKVIDHIDRNKKNNRLSNLRIATNSSNCINAKVRKNNSTGFPGVTFNNKKGKYVARIGYNYKRLHLGYYDTPEEAYIARAKKEIELFGEFANILPDFKHLLNDM